MIAPKQEPEPKAARSGGEKYEGCIRCQNPNCQRIWYWTNVSYDEDDELWLCDECRGLTDPAISS